MSRDEIRGRAREKHYRAHHVFWLPDPAKRNALQQVSTQARIVERGLR
jgi:hypothetical protein